MDWDVEWHVLYLCIHVCAGHVKVIMFVCTQISGHCVKLQSKSAAIIFFGAFAVSQMSFVFYAKEIDYVESCMQNL